MAILGIDIWPRSGIVFGWEGDRGRPFGQRFQCTNRQRRREVEHKERGREREGKKSVPHHAGKYTGCAISTHVSFHKFLSREGKLLGNCPWNLSAQLIITITCNTVKVSPKIKTSTHSANHHLSPAFHILFQLCVYLRCTVALKKEPQRSVTPIFQFQDTDNTQHLVGATWKKPFAKSGQHLSRSQNRTGVEAVSRRCPLAATRCSEPSNYTNLQEAVLIRRNPEDVKTSSAGGLVLTTNGREKNKNKMGGW